MRRLDGVSTTHWLNTKPREYHHTLKIGIFDVSKVTGGWSYAKFRDGLVKGMEFHPIFRCKVMEVPFGLHRPVWVEDPEFDIDYHMRYVSCPEPGDTRALCEIISQVYAYPLDPTKPLWQSWVIDRLKGNRVAVVTLLHHAYVDGTGASRLMERYFSDQPISITPAKADWQAEQTPSKPRLLFSALKDLPLTLIEGIPRAISGIRAMRKVRKEYAQAGSYQAPNPFKDSRDSPFNIELGHQRTFVYETFSLDKIRASSKRLGVTINDLFLAVVADVYRQFMVERGYDADRGPLLTTIPLERRPPIEEDDLVGNKMSADWLWLPSHISDPLARLQYARSSSLAMKEHFKAIEGADLASLMEILPLPMLRYPGKTIKQGNQATGMMANAILTNVKGPTKPLYWGEMKMNDWISIGPVIHGMGINVTVWSYLEKFTLCIMADKKLLPEGWSMIESFKQAFDIYEELAERSERQSAVL